MIAPPLPQALAPPPPFPAIALQTMAEHAIAPGMRDATYRMVTAAGPLVVHVVALDPREPSLHLGVVLAEDHIVSAGEALSAMAQRTGAVAGVNADYFDIGQTNMPLNVVVRAGELLRTPSQRVALDVRRDGSVHFENFAFTGTVRFGPASVPLTAINEYPPEGGAALLTPEFGPIRAAPEVTLFGLAASQDAPGNYRVTSAAAAVAQRVAGPLLAFGPAAKARGALPQIADAVQIEYATAPPLADLSAAVGGGPLLVAGGVPADDPNEPAPEERDRRFPVSGAALLASGTLLLFAVDGRQAGLSIGLTRPEFAALMLGFGARDGMAFDSGGSAELVAREPGDAAASVRNAPSDGEERAIANGLFAYSDAPLGPATALAVSPSPVVALANADVPVRVTRIDDAGHALGAAVLDGGNVVRASARGPFVVRAGALAATVPVIVMDRLAALDLEPQRPNPDPGGSVALSARGFDGFGRTVALQGGVRWSADRGSITPDGVYRAADRDAVVTASAGGALARVAIRVGRHSVALDAGDAETRAAYDFSHGQRIAGLVAFERLLPGEPLAFGIEIEGDGSNVGVRAAFRNRFGERRALTLAKRVDWVGWQTRTIVLPPDLNPPVTLVSLYAVSSLSGPNARASGSLGFRRASVLLPGTP